MKNVKLKNANEKSVSAIDIFGPPAGDHPANLSKRSAAVRALIEAKPGAEGRPFAPRKNAAPLVVIYKVMGRMFAILSIRGVEDVIVKCDPFLVSALRKEFNGVGHRSHLDRRFWISVRLDADVPMKEVRRLVSLSYDLVCAGFVAGRGAKMDGRPANLVEPRRVQRRALSSKNLQPTACPKRIAPVEA